MNRNSGGGVPRAAEDEAIALLAARLAVPLEAGWRGIGDDAAVLRADGPLAWTVDTVVAGRHGDLDLTTLADLGARAVGAALSDLAAMGAFPLGMLVAVQLDRSHRLDELYDGIGAAASELGVPVLGGDLVAAAPTAISVSALGRCGEDPPARGGAVVGETVLVTGPLGRASAGLRLLRAGVGRHPGDPALAELVEAHARPRPRLAEGQLAAHFGVGAMADLSDGLGLDLDRLCRASGVGVELEVLPVAEGATAVEAFAGGDDYELVLTSADPEGLRQAFTAAGLAPPIAVGRIVDQPDRRLLHGQPFAPQGWGWEVG